MNAYFPGQSVRVYLESFVLGVLTDPGASTITVTYPDDTTANPTPAQDETGQWHFDFVIPFPMQDGVGVYSWRSTGSGPSQNGYAEREFEVRAVAA